MFARLAAIATLALPLVSALTLIAPTGAATGSTVTITWQATTTDPGVFSLELVNTIFHNTFAIANNIQTSTGSLTLQLPQVPVGDGYTIEAINPSNINTVYATSGDFSVSAQSTPSATISSTTSTGTGTTTGTSLAAVSSATSPSTAASSSSSSIKPSSINASGAASFKFGVGPAVAILLSAVAGAAVLF